MITQNNLLLRCYYGAANIGVVFTGADRRLRSIVLELELLYPRPEILLDLNKEFSKELRFTFFSRYIELIENAIGIQRTNTHRQAFSKANQGLL